MIFGLGQKQKWKMGVLSSSQNKKVSYMSDERITNLEIKLSFTEDLIEKLNETVYKQQQQIEFLYRELKAIKEQASSSGGGSSSDSLKDEIPPHY
jgi:SlyX protein